MSAVVKVVRKLSASPERVFDAWLDPEKIRGWMVAPGPGEVLRVQLEARVGGKFSFLIRRQDGDVDHVGEYLELDQPRRLAFTWAVPKYSSEVTRVSLDFAPAGSGTEVTLVHEGVLEEYRERTEEGWGKILGAIEGTLGR
ncbi:MAG TPA: SRPBCC family protein [Myxococcaceae bacterium]